MFEELSRAEGRKVTYAVRVPSVSGPPYKCTLSTVQTHGARRVRAPLLWAREHLHALVAGLLAAHQRHVPPANQHAVIN